MQSKPGTTPFPNVLLDALMPSLKDTEWRVLCVVVRQTLGWKATGGERKAQDWLSHRYLKQRTGRHSEAVSRAIQALLERGLIVVQDGKGNRLHDIRSREQHRAKLFFAVSPAILTFTGPVSISEARKSKATKEKQTKEKHINWKLRNEPGLRVNSGWQRVGDLISPRKVPQSKVGSKGDQGVRNAATDSQRTGGAA